METKEARPGGEETAGPGARANHLTGQSIERRGASIQADRRGLQLVNSREAAERLGICERTVWALQKAGELLSIRIGRCVRFDLDDLCRWVDARRRGKPAGR